METQNNQIEQIVTNESTVESVVQSTFFAQQNNETDYVLKENEEFAGFWIRLAAFFSDIIIMTVSLLSIIGLLVYFITQNIVELYWCWLFVIPIGFFIACTPLFLSRTSATLGKYFFGLKVLDKNGLEPSLKISLKRSLYNVISFFIFGFLKIFKNDNRQSWSDGKLGTFVIHNKKKSKLLGGIFVLLLTTLLTFSTYFFMYYSWHYRMIGSDYYTVNMPGFIRESIYLGDGFPEYLDSSSTSTASVPFFGQTMTSSDGENIYAFSVLNFPSYFVVEDKVLSSLLKGVLLSNKVNLNGSGSTPWAPGSILTFSAIGEGKFLVGMLVGLRNRIYVLMVSCKPTDCNQKNSNKFIDSFF